MNTSDRITSLEASVEQLARAQLTVTKQLANRVDALERTVERHATTLDEAMPRAHLLERRAKQWRSESGA